MRRHLLLFALLVVGTHLASAQDDFRGEFLRQFDYSARRLSQLAEVMPTGSYAWSPGEGVMSVERVFMHIARYNYYYLASSLSIPAPEDVDVETMEALTGKEIVIPRLAASFEHVRSHIEGIDEGRLTARTTLYGREVGGEAVLLQLLAHMNEHVGQAIAYARMNGIVPPWSR
jgi:uncharacterized damage-inducible protein DinB